MSLFNSFLIPVAVPSLYNSTSIFSTGASKAFPLPSFHSFLTLISLVGGINGVNGGSFLFVILKPSFILPSTVTLYQFSESFIFPVSPPTSFMVYSYSLGFATESYTFNFSNVAVQLLSLFNSFLIPVAVPSLYNSTSIFSTGASKAFPLPSFHSFLTLISLVGGINGVNGGSFLFVILKPSFMLPSITILYQLPSIFILPVSPPTSFTVYSIGFPPKVLDTGKLSKTAFQPFLSFNSFLIPVDTPSAYNSTSILFTGAGIGIP